MPYDDFESYQGSTPQPEDEGTPQETDAEIEEIANAIEGEGEGSILDDDTALSALRLLKQELFSLGCKLADFKISLNPTGFDIKGLKINCRDPEQVLMALRDVQVAPGQLKPQSLYDKKPNSYATSAVLGPLKRKAEEELGLSLRAAGYENDYVVLSFFPAEEKPEPIMPPMEPPPEEMPEEEPPPEEGGEEPGLEDIPVEEVDWEAMGI